MWRHFFFLAICVLSGLVVPAAPALAGCYSPFYCPRYCHRCPNLSWRMYQEDYYEDSYKTEEAVSGDFLTVHSLGSTADKEAKPLNHVGVDFSKAGAAAREGFAGGTALVAAGIIQISEAAQDQLLKGKTEQNQQQLSQGLVNLADGNEIVRYAELTAQRTNQAQALQSRLASVGTKVNSKPISLSLERSTLPPTMRKALARMEEKSGVKADQLLKELADGGNVYDLAAKAKGLNLSGAALQKAAGAAMDKIGRSEEPVLPAGLGLADLMKDIETIAAHAGADPRLGSVSIASGKEAPPAKAGKESDAFTGVIEARAPSSQSEALHGFVERPTVGRSEVRGVEAVPQPSFFRELDASEVEESQSLFLQVRGQYQKRMAQFQVTKR